MSFWSKKKDPDQLHAEAIDAFERQDIRGAMQRFSQLCDLDPNSERLYYLGVLMDMAGIQDSAAQALRSSVDMDPSNSQAWYSLSLVHAQSGNQEEAFDAGQKAFEADPDDFRIVNSFARQLIQTPHVNRKDPAKALQLAKRACELTAWRDPICQATYDAAKKAVGNSGSDEIIESDVVVPESADQTFEIIAHFEKRFGRKANELALQNIVPHQVPIAVQTLETSSSSKQGVSVIFTTGMSNEPVPVSSEDDLQYAEFFMVIPAEWKIGNEINDRIWPWHQLQLLALRAHTQGVAYTRKPTVINLADSVGPLGVGTDFAAYLLLPNVKGYVDRYKTTKDTTVNFILAMPIYAEEYELAQGGVKNLLSRIRDTKTKPYMTPDRKNLGV